MINSILVLDKNLPVFDEEGDCDCGGAAGAHKAVDQQLPIVLPGSARLSVS